VRNVPPASTGWSSVVNWRLNPATAEMELIEELNRPIRRRELYDQTDAEYTYYIDWDANQKRLSNPIADERAVETML